MIVFMTYLESWHPFSSSSSIDVSHLLQLRGQFSAMNLTLNLESQWPARARNSQSRRLKDQHYAVTKWRPPIVIVSHMVIYYFFSFLFSNNIFLRWWLSLFLFFYLSTWPISPRFLLCGEIISQLSGVLSVSNKYPFC